MCCDSYDANPDDTIGQCPECEGDVDVDGYTTEEGCKYSPACKTCGYSPCDQSC